MKNAFKFAITLLVIVVSLTSCSSNDFGLSQNSITLNGNPFPIIRGSIIGVSSTDTGHAGISLISGTTTEVKTLTIDIPNFTKETISGTYSYPQKTGDFLLNDFLTNYIFFDLSQQTTSSNLDTGTATISHNGGSNYTVTVNLLMIDGKSFKGSYSGEFSEVFNNQ